MYLKVLLSVVLICIAASCDVVLDKFGWLPRYQISNGAFLTLYGTGWTGCWEACLHRKMCLSVSYNTDTLKCSLGKFADNKTYTGHASDVFMTPDWNGNPPEGQGPCKSRPCTLTKRCVPLWNGNHTCITEMKSVDLCVLLDVSGTTSASKFQNMVDSLLEVIGQLHDVRLAVTYFGNNNPEVKFGFDQNIDEQDQISALQGLTFDLKIGNKLKEGLQLVRDDIFSGSAGDRRNVMNVLLIMLYPNDVWDNNLEATAIGAKDAGIHIIVIGIGTCSNHGHSILERVGSEPLAENILLAPSFEDLLNMETEIADAIKRSI